MVTRRLSGTVIEIFSLADNGVTTLIFGVTWRHRSCDHSTPHVGFPIGGEWSLSAYLARLLRYSASKISRSRPWPFGSRDVIGHVTIRLPMGGFP